jgi:hypothetical protein
MVARPSNKAAKAVEEAARLFNHAISLMNATSGPVSMVVGPPYGSWVGGRIVVVWYQRQAAISPASAAAKFSVVPSMTALCPSIFRERTRAVSWKQLPKVGEA